MIKCFLRKEFRVIGLKPYDAKQPQECKICGYRLSHNKQGRFTSHLKEKHGITLENYLIKYYYNQEDLKCSYILCDKYVGLHRGKPKKYCSKSCASRGTPLVCAICGAYFDTTTRPNRSTKTCSDKCAKILKSRKIAEWHQSMSIEDKEKHFKKIITKTAKTRRKNHTPSWNSGKTGIYSQETIEKIRVATIKQFEAQKFRKTKIERVIEDYLQEINLEYKYSFLLEKRQYDFLLTKYKIIIECDGDYWHANPKFYPEPEDWQKARIKIDQEKNEIAQKNGYRIVRFWENDILNHFDYVKSIINDLLATTESETIDVKA
jgi:very-short-patch-repair endonuclease